MHTYISTYIHILLGTHMYNTYIHRSPTCITHTYIGTTARYGCTTGYTRRRPRALTPGSPFSKTANSRVMPLRIFGAAPIIQPPHFTTEAAPRPTLGQNSGSRQNARFRDRGSRWRGRREVGGGEICTVPSDQRLGAGAAAVEQNRSGGGKGQPWLPIWRWLSLSYSSPSFVLSWSSAPISPYHHINLFTIFFLLFFCVLLLLIPFLCPHLVFRPHTTPTLLLLSNFVPLFCYSSPFPSSSPGLPPPHFPSPSYVLSWSPGLHPHIPPIIPPFPPLGLSLWILIALLLFLPCPKLPCSRELPLSVIESN